MLSKVQKKSLFGSVQLGGKMTFWGEKKNRIPPPFWDISFHESKKKREGKGGHHLSTEKIIVECCQYVGKWTRGEGAFRGAAIFELYRDDQKGRTSILLGKKDVVFSSATKRQT